MTHSAIEALLERKIGVSALAMGIENLTKVIQQRMQACQFSDINTYYAHLLSTPKEWQTLVETVVVPETWFFRNHESFSFLGKYLVSQWQPHKAILRILSVPCSTGEEPYSIAMTVLDAGLAEQRFYIDAIDISENALQHARLGRYSAASFRSKESLFFRARYFSEEEGAYQVHAKIKNRVRFFQGNLCNDDFLSNHASYDIIFCRNLLIYWDSAAKAQGVNHLERLLKPGGLLFVGHAERPVFSRQRFDHVRHPGVFACQKRVQQKQAVNKPSLPNPEMPQKNVPKLVVSMVPDTTVLQNAVTSPENPLHAAQKLADQGDLHDALSLCQTYLTSHSDDSEAHFLAGVIYQALGKEESAIIYFNKTLYLNPMHLEALMYLIRLHEKQGNQNQVAYLKRRLQRIRAKQE